MQNFAFCSRFLNFRRGDVLKILFVQQKQFPEIGVRKPKAKKLRESFRDINNRTKNVTVVLSEGPRKYEIFCVIFRMRVI